MENGETDRDNGRDKGRKNGEKGGLGEVEIKRNTESVATKRVKGKQRERECKKSETARARQHHGMLSRHGTPQLPALHSPARP
jgi:hypothetical protein